MRCFDASLARQKFESECSIAFKSTAIQILLQFHYRQWISPTSTSSFILLPTHFLFQLCALPSLHFFLSLSPKDLYKDELYHGELTNPFICILIFFFERANKNYRTYYISCWWSTAVFPVISKSWEKSCNPFQSRNWRTSNRGILFL